MAAYPSIGAQWSISPRGTGVDLYVQGERWLHRPTCVRIRDWADEIEFRTRADIVVFGDDIHAATKDGAEQNAAAVKLFRYYEEDEDCRESLLFNLLFGDDDIIFTLSSFVPAQETSKRAKTVKQGRSRGKRTTGKQPHGSHVRTNLHVNQNLLALAMKTRGENYSLAPLSAHQAARGNGQEGRRTDLERHATSTRARRPSRRSRRETGSRN